MCDLQPVVSSRCPPSRCLPLVGLLIMVTLCAGCFSSREPELETQYGKVSRQPTSLNSVSMLAEKLRQRGANVTNRSRISPGISRFNTIFWFPDTTNCPSEEAVAALNDWLQEDPYHTLVYVGGGYDATADYLNQVADAVPVKSREEMMRLIAEQEIESLDSPDFFWTQSRDQCEWFKQVRGDQQRSDRLTGRWIDIGYSGEKPELWTDYRLESESPVMIGYNAVEVDPMLIVDGEPFAYNLVSDEYWLGDLIVVSNASFLVNYALADPQKEQLADQLLDEIYLTDEVLFLESGPGNIRVSDSDYENHNSWGWIAQRPLRYIVPHFLMWGVVFCFVFFPIFGRPRRRRVPSNTSFRNHVNAVAKQMARSGRLSQAAERIRQFRELTGDRGRHNH